MEIYNYLGHRVPFVFLDRYSVDEPGKCRGEVEFSPHRYRYYLNGAVDFCEVVEALAQLSAGDIALTERQPKAGYFARIQRIDNHSPRRFHSPVRFDLQVERVSSLENYYTYRGTGVSGGQPVVETEFSIMCVEAEGLENAAAPDLTGITAAERTYDFNSEIYGRWKAADVGAGRLEVAFSFQESAEYLKGHFVGNPVVPGVYLIRSAVMASSALLFQTEMPDYRIPVEVSSVKFVSVVRPGEDLVLNVTGNPEQGEAGVTLVDGQGRRKASLRLRYV